MASFQCLRAGGNILVAAQGQCIHTFSLDDGSHLSTWKHPDCKISCETGGSVESQQNALEVHENLLPANQNDRHGDEAPTAKRRKLSGGVELLDISGDTKARNDEGHLGENHNSKSKKQKNPNSNSKNQELTLVTDVIATAEFHHVIAVTGQDKTIRVFEHDGAGKLILLSERIMPKRPSSITLTPDGRTILSADKFGDVYSLPLLPTKDFRGETNGPGASTSKAPRALKFAADESTVHTQTNLRALEHQKKQLQQAQSQSDGKPEAPTFEHDLLLGHVSMLTAMTVAHHGKRQFILTADKDEHIRVSRGLPQTHIIESFCLGHKAFVSKLCIPDARPDILISGGGDNEVFVWDWHTSRLLSKLPLLEHVQRVVPKATKLAVSGIYSLTLSRYAQTDKEATLIFVICERVPALYCFQLTEASTLKHSQTTHLKGNPLDVAICAQEAAGLRLVISVDSNSKLDKYGVSKRDGPSSLVVLEMNQYWQWCPNDFRFQDENIDIGVELPPEQAQRLLYTWENLRKLELRRGEAQEAYMELLEDQEIAEYT